MKLLSKRFFVITYTVSHTQHGVGAFCVYSPKVNKKFIVVWASLLSYVANLKIAKSGEQKDEWVAAIGSASLLRDGESPANRSGHCTQKKPHNNLQDCRNLQIHAAV